MVLRMELLFLLQEEEVVAAPTNEKPTLQALGIGQSAPKTHPIVFLYARDRLNQTRSAKERTVNTQLGYLGKIVHFVESQIGDGEKMDRWDFFRHPNHHLLFTQKLLQSRNQPAGNDKYRKVMASVCSWSSKEGSGTDVGRWRVEEDFPDPNDRIS